MSLGSPAAGVHYPGNLAAVRAWFPDDQACLDYLDWLRWPDGFRCTHCGAENGWRLPAEDVPGLVELEVAVPRSAPASR